MISRIFAACSLQSLSKVTSKFEHVSNVHPLTDVFVFKYALFLDYTGCRKQVSLVLNLNNSRKA